MCIDIYARTTCSENVSTTLKKQSIRFIRYQDLKNAIEKYFKSTHFETTCIELLLAITYMMHLPGFLCIEFLGFFSYSESGPNQSNVDFFRASKSRPTQ